MASRRRTIVDAIVTKLNTITVANGYVNELGPTGAQPWRTRSNARSTLPIALVVGGEEDKSINSATYYECQLDVAIRTSVEGGAEGTDLWAKIDDLTADVEKALLASNAQDPPLLVTGVVDIVLLGHEARAEIETGVDPGALIGCRVRYRHSISDPSVFP